MNILNLGLGERSSCLAWGCHIRSRALAKEAVVFVFELLGRWVSQLALQFVFGAVGSLVEWALPSPPIDSSVCGAVGSLVEWALPGPPMDSSVCGAVGSLVEWALPGPPIDSSVCVWSCVGRLVGTLSGLCPVRQPVFAAPQFVEDFCVL